MTIKETTAVAKSPTDAAVSFEKLLRRYDPVRDPAPQAREKIANYNPTAGTSRVLLGIRIGRSGTENRRLRVIRKSYLEYHKKTNTTATVCSLPEVLAAQNPEDCQLVYAVVYGGGEGYETDQKELIHISTGNPTKWEYERFLDSNFDSKEAVVLNTFNGWNDYTTIMAWTKWSSQLDEKKFGMFDYTAFSATGVLIQPPIFWNQNQILKESQENVFGGVEPFNKSLCDSAVPCLNHNFLIFSRDVTNVLGSVPKVPQGSESVTTSVWNVLQSNSADSKKLQAVPLKGLIQTGWQRGDPRQQCLIDIALWDAYIEKEHRFKDEVEEKLVRESPAEVTSFYGKSRVLLGIFTTNLSEVERERRQAIRDTWVQHYADSTSPNRVCSLQQLQKRQVREEECQIIYTFVIGAGGSTRPTEKMDTPNINRMVVPKDQIVDPEPDVVYLNIKENTNEGKSETWFHYAVLASQFNYFDYVGKMDTDTVLIPTRFTDMLNTWPKFPNNVRTILGDPIVEKDSEGRTLGAAYFLGGFYIMSTDLARYITTIDRRKMKHEDEDITIGNYVNSHPKLINRKMLDVHCNRCRIYKRADDYRIFYQDWMKNPPPQPHIANATKSILRRYNFTVHADYPEPQSREKILKQQEPPSAAETTAVAKSPTVAAVLFGKLLRRYDNLLRRYGPKVRDPAPQSRGKNLKQEAGNSRVLLGIRMIRSTPENKRLRVIKKSYLEYHKKTNTTATVCSLPKVLAAKNPEDCQMVYAVVYGGGEGHETDRKELIHISSGNATKREYKRFLKSNFDSKEAVVLDTSDEWNDFTTIMAWTKWSSQLDEKKFGKFDYIAFSTTGVLIQPPIFWNQNQILKESQENVFGGVEPFDKSLCDSAVPCLNHNFLIFSRDVTKVLESAPQVSQGSESVTTSVWNVLQSNSADSKKLQAVPLKGLIQTGWKVGNPHDLSLIDIALWDAYIEKEHRFFEKDEVEEKLVRESPAEVTSFYGKSRVLLGILTTNLTEVERERRQAIRETWVQYYANSNTPNRVCSLQQLQKRQVPEEECQIIYTFVVGAGGSTRPTEKMDTPNINRMFVPKDQIVDPEPDVVYLNIKENMNQGKSETWFHYAVLASQFNYFDYVGKMDTDTVLIPTRFTDMLNTWPKFPNNVRTILGDTIVQKDSEYLTRGAAYFNGGFYIMSTDLARYITTIDRRKIKHQHEDINIGNYVNSNPKLINRKSLDVHCNRCRVHPIKKIENYRIFYHDWMKTSPREPRLAYAINSLQRRYNLTVHVDYSALPPRKKKKWKKKK